MCACRVTWTAWQCLHALKAHGRVHQVGFIPHWKLTSAAELAQWQVAVALSLSCTRAQIHTYRYTTPHPPPERHAHSLSVSSSLILRLPPFHPVLYICHIGVPPMQLVPALIPRSPSEMCSSKHFTLAYAKGKWQRQVCDRQRTVCAQGCRWQTRAPLLSTLLLYSK